MTTWTPSSRSGLAPVAKAGAIGGVAVTLMLRAAYEELFGLSPLAAPLLDEPSLLIATPFLLGAILAAALGRWTGESLGRRDVLALAGSLGLLPAVVVFAFAVRVGVVTGFGPAVSVQSFAHLVVGSFFVLLYAGFGAALAGFLFVVVFLSGGVGALLAGTAARRFAAAT